MKLGRWIGGTVLVLCVWASQYAFAEQTPKPGLVDSRIRVVAYDPDQVIKIRGYVGYQIFFEFAEGETFVNLAAGDNKALDVGYEANHLVIKPLAEKVATNITVITNRRVYQFDYSATAAKPNPALGNVIYSLRFIYPQDEAKKGGRTAGARADQSTTGRSGAAAASQCELLGVWIIGHTAGECVRRRSSDAVAVCSPFGVSRDVRQER